MAQYPVTHSCGHEVTHQLYGKHKDRDSKVAWLETKPCSECYQQQLAAQRAEQSQVSASVNALAGLPTLTGSEKQVAWAETLRSKFISETAAIIEKADRRQAAAADPAHGVSQDIRDRAAAELAGLKDFVAIRSSEASAKVWIDSRFDSVIDLFRGWVKTNRPDLLRDGEAE